MPCLWEGFWRFSHKWRHGRSSWAGWPVHIPKSKRSVSWLNPHLSIYVFTFCLSLVITSQSLLYGSLENFHTLFKWSLIITRKAIVLLFLPIRVSPFTVDSFDRLKRCPFITSNLKPLLAWPQITNFHPYWPLRVQQKPITDPLSLGVSLLQSIHLFHLIRKGPFCVCARSSLQEVRQWWRSGVVNHWGTEVSRTGSHRRTIKNAQIAKPRLYTHTHTHTHTHAHAHAQAQTHTRWGL